MRFSLIWQNLFYPNFIKVKVPLSPLNIFSDYLKSM